MDMMVRRNIERIKLRLAMETDPKQITALKLQLHRERTKRVFTTDDRISEEG